MAGRPLWTAEPGSAVATPPLKRLRSVTIGLPGVLDCGKNGARRLAVAGPPSHPHVREVPRPDGLPGPER
ncbi:hypothetical protein FAIPA1_10214 [Frankia sp. AiPs1]